MAMNEAQDHFLDLKRLAERSCLSVRTLREHITSPVYPLPCYRLKGKVLVNWPEFKTWMDAFKYQADDLNSLVDDAVNRLLSDG